MTVYDLNDKGGIVNAMLKHMAQQIENPALRNSKFVFDRILHMDIDFHRLNLTRLVSVTFRFPIGYLRRMH